VTAQTTARNGRAHKTLRALAALGVAAMLALSGTIVSGSPPQTQAAGTSSTPGRVLAWGFNSSGQLGNGTTTDSSTAVQVNLPTGTTVAAVAGGAYHTLALTSGGQVLAWGLNGSGQLGNGTTTNSSTPVPLFGPAITEIAAGFSHSLALTYYGQVLAWGDNTYGQLGNGTTTPSSTPIAVSLPSGTTVTAIASGLYQSLALTSTGQVLAWGYNPNGQLGNGTTTNSSTPVPVSLPSGTTATAIAGGYLHSLALTSSGQVLAWGDNSVGQLGNGTITNSTIPVQVSLPAGTIATALSSGRYHSLALTSTHQVLAWGDNNHGQLGNGGAASSTTPVQVSLPPGTAVTAIAGGSFQSLALTSAGQVLAWGLNATGQLGNGTTTDSSTPVLASMPTATAIASGSDHSLAIQLPTRPPGYGTASAWGSNGSGQLGNGTTANSSTPIQVGQSLFTAIAGGGNHSLALTLGGRVLAWGDNTYGQLGNGTTTNSSTPVSVNLPTGTVVTAIAAGPVHSLAVTSTGKVFAWGRNNLGELGCGTCPNSSTPVAVSLPSGTTVTAVAAGANHSLALTSAGKVLGWGADHDGQLGDGGCIGTCFGFGVPVSASLPSGTTVTAIAAGANHSLARTSNGQVLAWGLNSSGQLGNGATANALTPVGVTLPSGTTVTAISGGDAHSLALTSTGKVLAWGDNSSGQLGNGTTTGSTTPVAVSLPAGAMVTSIAAGGFHSLALTWMRQVLAWGNNQSGQLGNGTTIGSLTPVVVSGLQSAVIAVAAGEAHSLTIVVTTTVDMASSSNPSAVGGSVTYTASLFPIPDAGSVTFTDNSTILSGCGGVPVDTSTGNATCTTTYSAAGSHAIVATYSGDTNYASSSGSLTQQVNAARATSTTTLTASSNQSVVNSSVTYTATVTPFVDGGTVAFTDNGATMSGCDALAVGTNNWQVTCTVTYTVAGSHSIVATYSGDPNYATSSASVTHQVNATQLTTTTALVSSSNPSGQYGNVTFTATVTPIPDAGTVSFTGNGIYALCLGVAVNTTTGQAICTYNFGAPGSYSVVASYSGDTNYTASSASLTQAVLAYATPTVVLPAVSNGAYGGYVTAATIQNIGSQPETVEIAYYDQNGAPVGTGDVISSLPVNGSWTVRQDNGDSFPSSGGDAAQAGSAVVSSSGPVAAFVNEFAPGNVGDATSYSGVQVASGVGTTLYAPTIVNNAYGGYTTGIGLLNQGSTPTDVTITYRDGSGAIVRTQTVPGLAAHAYHALYSGDATLSLPGGFAGTATITSTGAQPLGAIVNETGPGGQFSSYDAVPSGSISLFAPAALNNAYGGYNTGMGIVNTTSTAGTVTINYFDAVGTSTTTTYPIAANGSLGVYQGTDIATAGAYTANITSTVAIAGIVNEVAPSNTSAKQSTSYNMFATGSASLHLPLVENGGSDPWNTGEGIMNTGTTYTTVTVTYYDTATGAAIGAPQMQTVAPQAFWGLYQPTGGMPGGKRATAVITTSSGGQVAVICNESSSTTFMSYDGQ
jgi:alpha-tubulin suppressor-like RCC1 family protein